MSLTIEFPPDLEQQLRREAEREGVETSEFVVRTIADRLAAAKSTSPALPAAEVRLLQQIGEGLPEATWNEYHQLVARRRAGTLMPDEHTRLIGLTDEVEEWNARRVGYLAELAHLRGAPIRALMDQVGIRPAEHA